MEDQRQRQSSSTVRHPFSLDYFQQLQETMVEEEEEEEEEGEDDSHDDFGNGITKKKYCKVPYRRNAMGACTRSIIGHCVN